MKPQPVPVITVDGPVGSGKGTVASRVARELHWHYLDSGTLYRVLALYATLQGVSLENEQELASLAQSMPLECGGGRRLLDGKDVEDEIRNEKVGRQASCIASYQAVRQALLTWQRRFAIPPGLVADGRDMGTVVFPQADCKIYLTASTEQRAQRRFKQLREKGFDVNIHQLAEEINERDRRDCGRSVSPLIPAEDAILLDTTEMNPDQAVEAALQLAACFRGKT